MAYGQPEQVILPARFLSSVAHLVTILMVIYGMDDLTVHFNIDDGKPHQQRQTLKVMSYLSVACLGVEFIGLFTGVTIFLSGLNCLHTFMHSIGAILTVLYIEQHWRIHWYIFQQLVFVGIPFLFEALGIFGVAILKIPL